MVKPPENGACVGKPTEWWFPFASNRSSAEDRKQSRDGTLNAIMICNSCPQREACLDYSLVWEPHGIWGGHPEGERDRMRRRLGIVMMRQSSADINGYVNRV
jgi:hypothetical protein